LTGPGGFTADRTSSARLPLGTTNGYDGGLLTPTLTGLHWAVHANTFSIVGQSLGRHT
jgi:hypothetical protein